jgi:hypothetical protein
MTEQTPGFTRTRRYQEGLSYEAVLTNFLGYIAQWRVKDPKLYATGVETLILMCPSELYDKGMNKLSELGLTSCEYQSINSARMRLYDRLWRFMNECLEHENLIYRTSYVKTYE